MKSDIELRNHVLAELDWDPSLDATKIAVTALNHVVTLTGTVGRYAEKIIAEKAAKRVYAVKGVVNDVQVELPGAAQLSDTDLAAAALTALKHHVLVPHEHVRVTVRNGHITLEGTVNKQIEQEAAERAVRNMIGVKGVVNLITVKGDANLGDVKKKITEAFHRHADLDARRIDVETKDGKVILHGNVRSWHERKNAERAAWAAPGVTVVDNRLSVAW